MSGPLIQIAEPLDVRPGDVEAWVDAAGGRFEEAYRYMRTATGWRPGPCFVAAWLSLHKDDRGELATFGKLAEWLGVSRQTVYKWRGTYRLDEWAEQMRLLALRGDKLGNVDRVTYEQAIKGESPVDARRLYYQRVGVLGQELTIYDQTEKQRLESWLEDLRRVEE